MPDLITRRNNTWHFVRRVPIEYAAFDPRNIIKNSTKIRIAADRAGKAVTCAEKNIDQYGRGWRFCSVTNGDVGDWLVRRRLAIDYKYYSRGKYREAEAVARAAHTGIWAGGFVEPKRFRDCMKGLGQVPACSEP
jgi:hypothetical protein